MHTACLSGNIDVVKYILSLNVILNSSVGKIFFYFHKIFLCLVEWNYKQFFLNRTISHYACLSGNVELVKYLISLHVYIQKSDIFPFLFL